MQTDANKEMKEVLKRLTEKERLLLHTCCAVCAGGVLAREFEFAGAKKRLSDFFDITLYFYNPNIDTQEEHNQRAGEMEKLRGFFGVKGIVLEAYRPGEFLQAVNGFENAYEGGQRCGACFDLRLQKTASFAAQNQFDRFATTLSVSPHKNSDVVNSRAQKTKHAENIPFLPADFKKENGFLIANQIAKELNIYRQTYCGCMFSKKQ